MTDHKLHVRSDLHLARKAWHVVGVLTITAIYVNVPRHVGLQLITLATLLFVSLDLLRQQWKALNKVLVAIMHPFMRKSEKDSLAGTTYLFLGVFLIMLIFPQPIVTLSLLFLAVSDPLASYFGVRYGKDKLIGQKSLQGSIAAFIACTVIFAAYCYSTNVLLEGERLIVVSLLAGLIGSASELIPIGKLDDNLSMPLLSSVLLWLLFFVFGGF